MVKTRIRFALFILIVAVWSKTITRAADTLPGQLSDDAFWKLIESSSEAGGSFQSENFLSNETGFQMVIPTLSLRVPPGGVYMGVGPEQNFTYIAAIRPKIAFIVDIRRQNMLEHMIYKALFEMSDNRADFLSKLFSRKRPAGLSDASTPDQLLAAFRVADTDNDAYAKTLQDITNLLVKKHKFGLTNEDQVNIEHVYSVFRDWGPDINYNSGTLNGRGRGGGGMPNYVDVMTATDPQGQQRSYLATEENYRFLRDFEGRNMLIPLTGDFGGKKAIRAVGEYLKEHGAVVGAFYLSNVENYLFQNQGGPGNPNGGAANFYGNVATLPLDSSSTFIRSRSGGAGGGIGGVSRPPNELASIQETLNAVKDGRIRFYQDVFNIPLSQGDAPGLRGIPK
jgi:hypothetical protein